MSRTIRRRVVWLCAALICLSLALGYVRVGGTFAIWQGEATNTGSAFAAGWIGPATGLGTPTPSGYGAGLAWTPGTAGPVTGQQVYGADGGTGASASCGTYGLVATLTSASTSSYTPAGASTANGHWWCYKLVSTSATAWTASATFTPVRVGLIPTTVAIANGGTAGKIDSNDTITITFNQNVGAATGTKACTFPGTSGAGTILLGDSTCSTTADTYTVGKITGVTVGGARQGLTATTTMSGAQITFKITQNGQTVSGTPTFTASSSVVSSAGSAAGCTASNCTVTATGGF